MENIIQTYLRSLSNKCEAAGAVSKQEEFLSYLGSVDLSKISDEVYDQMLDLLRSSFSESVDLNTPDEYHPIAGFMP